MDLNLIKFSVLIVTIPVLYLWLAIRFNIRYRSKSIYPTILIVFLGSILIKLFFGFSDPDERAILENAAKYIILFSTIQGLFFMAWALYFYTQFLKVKNNGIDTNEIKFKMMAKITGIINSFGVLVFGLIIQTLSTLVNWTQF